MNSQNETANETSSLKTLTFNTLKRLERNRPETKGNILPSSSVFHVPSISRVSHVSFVSDEYEERLAIAEYDGHQTGSQAQSIAYLDAFVSVLTTLPYDTEKSFKEDWFKLRIKEAQHWLISQGFQQPI